MTLPLAVALGVAPGLLVGLWQWVRRLRLRRARAAIGARISERMYEWRNDHGERCGEPISAANVCAFRVLSRKTGRSSKRSPEDDKKDPEGWVVPFVSGTGERVPNAYISDDGSRCRLEFDDEKWPWFNEYGREVKVPP